MKKMRSVLAMASYVYLSKALNPTVYFVCIWALVSGGPTAFAQQQPLQRSGAPPPATKAQVDSLYRTLKTAPDSARSRLYLALSRLPGQEPKMRIAFADTALIWANRFPDRIRLAEVYYQICLLNKNTNNLLVARKAYLKSLEYTDRNDLPKMGAVLNSLGEVYARGGEDATAIEYLSQALEKYEAVKDTLGIAFTNNNLGNIFTNRQEPEQALPYYYKAKAAYLRLKTKDRNRVNKAIANIAATLHGSGRYDEALTVYEEALTYLDDSPDARVGKAVVYMNVGYIWTQKKEYTKAIKNFQTALSLVKLAKNQSVYISIAHNLGSAYYLMKRYDEARRWINIAQTETEKYTFNRESVGIFRQKSVLDSISGDFRSAYLNLNRAFTIHDSLFGEESLIEFQRGATRFELKREHQTDSLQAVNARQTLIKETQKRDRKQYAGIFVGLLALAALLPLLFRFQAAERFGVVLRFIVALLGFEFLLIVLDPYFSSLSHDVPFGKFGLNVAVAAVFSPLFEYLQRNLEKKGAK